MQRSSNEDILFYKGDMFSAIENQKKAISQAVDEIPGSQLRCEESVTLAEELASRLTIDVPELCEENISVSQPREVQIETGYPYEHRTRYVKGMSVTFTVPFKGDRILFFVSPSTSNLNPPRATVNEHNIQVTFSGTNLEQEKIKQEFEQILASIKQFLGWQLSDVTPFNKELKGWAFDLIEARKKRLLEGDSLVAGLGYRVI